MAGKGTGQNPWKEIALSDYENHMKLDDVRQLQALSEMMKDQFRACEAERVMILGIAGGNGLAHLVPGQFERIYGVDINGDYLDECQRRYAMLGAAFQTIETDLTDQALTLPRADLLVANLLIEYIGYDHFKRAVKLAGPRYVSCVIQVNTESEAFVSVSPYLHAFDRLCEVHHPVAGDSLTEAMAEIGYKMVLKEERELPNGKKLVRLDYRFAWDEGAGAMNQAADRER